MGLDVRIWSHVVGPPRAIQCMACSRSLYSQAGRKDLYIEQHNEALATAGKAIMEGAKGGCLAVLLADAGWHGKVTGLSNESRIHTQVLPDVPDVISCAMQPDIRLF